VSEVDYYVDSENGTYTEQPDHPGLVGLIQSLNTTDNTFLVVSPENPDLPWNISVSLGITAFGGYEVHSHDSRTSENVKKTAANPAQIATDILAWIHDRA
jgi:hypothetical protein